MFLLISSLNGKPIVINSSITFYTAREGKQYNSNLILVCAAEVCRHVWMKTHVIYIYIYIYGS